MSGSSMGTIFKVTTFGESHGAGLGAVIDGCPAGIPITEETIQYYLDLRKPGQTRYATPRKESDRIHILSGIFKGKTTGTPILLLAENESQRSGDYQELASCYRPGHADYTMEQKYGFRDYRGGGRTSGRETLGRVAAGAVAIEFLKTLGIEICAYTKSIGSIRCEDRDYASHLSASIPFADRILSRELQKLREDKLSSPLFMPDHEASLRAEQLLSSVMEEYDSIGGIIECVVNGMPAGIGEPVFDKLDASLAKAMLSIGAVKGFELGSGFSSAVMKGTMQNDPFYPSDASGSLRKSTNHAGGILGGISDGSDLLFRLAVKPTPSIAADQTSVDNENRSIRLSVKGRHDPVIVPRAVVVTEAMTALVLADALMLNMSAKLETIQSFYQKDRLS